MAYPTVNSYSTGVITDVNQYSHTITLPATISAGDLIIVALTTDKNLVLCDVDDTSSSSNFMRLLGSTAIDTQSTWWNIFDDETTVYPLTLSIIMAKAKGGGLDFLTVSTYYTFPSKMRHEDYYSIYAKPSYICYSISGVKWDSGIVWGDYGYPVHRYRTSFDETTNWNLKPLFLTGTDDNDVDDYLWLAFYGAGMNKVATAAPSGWSDLHTAQGSVLVLGSSSVSSCQTTTNSVSNLDPGACTAPSAQWIGVLMKIYPATGSGSTSITTDTSVGVGTYIYKELAYKYVAPTDSIEVTPVDQKYHSDQTPDEDNPYGYYIQVVSSGAWTASWNVGTHFYANVYSGSEGITYVGVYCNSSNSSGLSYTDTLLFDGPGITIDDCNVEQYSS